MNDIESRVNWRELDMRTHAGEAGIDREIAIRRGMDYDNLKTLKHLTFWSDNINQALLLPVENEARLVLSRYRLAADPGERYQAIIVDTAGNEGREWGAEPAIAICRAWLAWHDAAHPKSDKLSPPDTECPQS